jgi:hypothetical protein
MLITLEQGNLNNLFSKRANFVGLAICGLVIGLSFHIAFASRYSLEQYGERHRQSIGTLTNFSNEGAYWFMGGMAVLFVAYALGYRLIARSSGSLSPSHWRRYLALIIIGGIAFNLVLLPMYPVDASDVYDNIIRGRMSALYGLNPLADVPNVISDDEFYLYASWRFTPSAYGPAWELLARGTSALMSGSSRDQQILAYKLVVVAGYGLTALFIGLILRQIAPRRLLTGAYLFMWNPLVLYMTAGTGHNDALMAACVAFALYCLSRRWYVAATLGATLGTLVKFIPALLIPIIAIMALRDLDMRRRVRYVLLSALLCGGLSIILYAPYWHGWETLRLSRRSIMYTGSVAAVARQWLMPYLDGISDLTKTGRHTPKTSAFLANGTLLVFGLFYLSQLIPLWRKRDPMTPLRVTTRIFMFYLLVVSLWFHAWYVIWLIALVALLEDTPIRRLVLVFSYLVTWQAFLVNYFTIQPRGGNRLPWLDLVPVAIYMGYAWSFTGWYQIDSWLRRLHANPLDRAVGAQLQAARENMGLTLSDVSDELAIRYDYLAQYEQGTRPIRLDDGRMLAQRLDMSLEDWLGMKA